MKCTFAVRDKQMKILKGLPDVTVTIRPESTLRELFRTLADGIGCNPLSLSLRTSIGDVVKNIPHPGPQWYNETMDSLTNEEVIIPFPDKRMSLSHRRVLIEPHSLQVVFNKSGVMRCNRRHSVVMRLINPYLFVVRVLDPININISQYVTDKTVSNTKYVYQAIQYIFGEILHNRHTGENYVKTRYNCEDIVSAFFALPAHFQQELDVLFAVYGIIHRVKYVLVRYYPYIVTHIREDRDGIYFLDGDKTNPNMFDHTQRILNSSEPTANRKRRTPDVPETTNTRERPMSRPWFQ